MFSNKVIYKTGRIAVGILVTLFAIPVNAEQIQLKKLCSITEGHLFHSKSPIDLSLEKSGKALLFLNDRRSAVFEAPDCKILSRYSNADFANNTISKDGSGLFSKDRGYGSKYTKKGIGVFGLETRDGKLITLTPPKKFNQTNAEFPKISLDGSAVIWQLIEKKKEGNRTRVEIDYVIHDLSGKPVKGPSKWEGGNPSMIDMEHKTYIASSRDGISLLDWNGEIIGGPVSIPGVSLGFSHSPPIKVLSRDLNTWVAWDTGMMSMIDGGRPFVLWKTERGQGRYELEEGGMISNVSVSGDGHYVGVAYKSSPGFFSKKVDFLVTLISTETGKVVFNEVIESGMPSGMVSHKIALLKNDFIAINNIQTKNNWAQTDSVILYKINQTK